MLIVLAAAGATAAITLSAGYRASVAAHERHAAVMAKTLSEAALEPAYELDVKALRQLAASILAGEDATGAYFLDAGGRVLTDGTDDNPMRGKQLGHPAVWHAKEYREWATRSGGGMIRVAGPIEATAETHLGYVVLEYSTDRLFSGWLAHLRTALALTGACILFAGGAALILASRIAQPLEQLAGYAQRHRESGRGSTIPAYGPGPVGRLAQEVTDVLMQPPAGTVPGRQPAQRRQGTADARPAGPDDRPRRKHLPD